MQIYAEAGITPWKNLIVTYDDENGLLDLRTVESEIINRIKKRVLMEEVMICCVKQPQMTKLNG